jgi:hypothetical protein
MNLCYLPPLIAIFLICCVGLAFSPLGKAVAERIRGNVTTSDAGVLRSELAEHRGALDQKCDALQRKVAELAERVDFAERLLAKRREPDRLVPPKP